MRPHYKVRMNTFDIINTKATKAINELTNKECLDACDIKAIEKILEICKFKSSDFTVPQI